MAPVEYGFHPAKSLLTGILTNSIVSFDAGTPLGDIHRYDLVREEPVLPRLCREPVRSNGKRVLILPGDAQRRIFRNILCLLSHNEVAHGIRETHHQTDARWIFLEVQERGNEGKSAFGTFSSSKADTASWVAANKRTLF